MLADTNLYAITYETEGGLSTIFTVEVDMDEATAELRVLKEIRAILDDQHINLDDAGVGEVIFEEVPKKVDSFNIILEEDVRKSE